MSARTARPPSVYLAGDPALVEEFGSVLAAGGIAVACAAPPRGGTKGRRPVFRTAPSPARGTAAAAELTLADVAAKRTSLVRLDRTLPPPAPILSASATVSVAEQASWLRHPGRLVGIGAFPTLLGGDLLEACVAPQTSPAALERARTLLAPAGKELTVVQDRAGLVMARILCMMINEACFALTEQIASPGDIDTAMTLGTNHPRGPVEWADRIGVRTVLAVLEALARQTGEERYRPAPVLRQMIHEPGLQKS